MEPRARARLGAAAFLAWCAAVLVLFQLGDPARFHPLLHQGRRVGLLLGLGLAAWGVGDVLAERFGWRSRPPPAPTALRLALGFGALAWLWLALGFAGFLRPWLAVAVLLAGVGVATWRRRALAPPVAEIPRGALLPLALILAATLIALPMAFAPPASTDELTYHLTVPQWHVAAGRILPLERSAHAAFPFLVEMLYAWALLLGEPVVARGLHLTLAGCAVALVASGSAEGGSREGAWWGAAALATTPVFLVNAAWAWVDAASALAVTAGTLLLWRAARSGEARDGVAAGIAWGMALGTKYSAALYLGAALIACVAARRGEGVAPLRSRARAAALAATLAVTLAAPFFVRNALVHGNPTHPLGAAAWGGRGDDATYDELFTHRGERDTLVERLRGPLAYSLWDDQADAAFGFLWLLAAPTLFFIPVGALGRRCHLVAVGCMLALSLAFGASGRLQLPALALMAIPLGRWLGSWWAAGGARRAAAVALLALSGASNLMLVAWHHREHFDPLRVALGFESESAYLRRMEPGQAALDWLNARPGAVVLAVGADRLFHLRRPVIASGPLDTSPARDLVRESGSLRAFVQRLRAEGVTHVLVDRTAFEAHALRGPGRRAWTDEELTVLREFFRTAPRAFPPAGERPGRHLVFEVPRGDLPAVR